MIKREEKKIAAHNVGQIKEKKLTLENVVKPNFAYIEDGNTNNMSTQQSYYIKASALASQSNLSKQNRNDMPSLRPKNHDLEQQ